jgi:hypothetical protein
MGWDATRQVCGTGSASTLEAIRKGCAWFFYSAGRGSDQGHPQLTSQAIGDA